ncbi:MAG TPA: PLP-dependent aminotransferase family protein [Bacillota bacterium]|nr:PLP-dependent aminotransferase family protein [Bacillota bacterium]
MLTFFFDNESQTPLYEQLYHFIKKAIENGELKADEKLPSKRKFANHLKISVITVENAYNQLMAEGYIRSVPKSGFYVLPYVGLIPAKKIRKPLVSYQKKEKDYLVDFRTNQVDQDSFPYLGFAKIEKEILQDFYHANINKTDFMGLYSLRVKIAELLFEYRGIETSPESIVIGSGSEHLISLLVLLLGRENVFGVEEPGYLKNYNLYRDYGSHSKTIPLDDQGIDLEKAMSVDVIHVTPSHQFPMGIVTTISRRIELLNWAYENPRRYIIEDDYDSEFRFSGIPIPAMKSMDTRDKVIYMNSFSKSLAPSFRVSFMVLPEKLLKKYHDSYAYFTCSVPVITQLVLERFIANKDYERHLNRMKNIYKSKRDELITKLKNSSFKDKIAIEKEESGLHFLMKIKTAQPIKVWIDKAKVEGIRVYGIDEYRLKPEFLESEKQLVLGYSHLSSNDFDTALERLEKAWFDLS